MTDGLKDKYRTAIIDILSANKRVKRAVLFGSRAMETFTPTSDVDIALFGDELTLTDQAQLAADIEELTMPQSVDLLLHKSITSKKLLKHIEEHGVEWWRSGERLWAIGSEWRTASLADAPLEIIDGDRGRNYPKQSDFKPVGHCLFLNAGNVTFNGFNFSNCAFITEWKDKKLRKGKLQRYDLVLTTRGTVGNAAYYDENIPIEHIRINSGMVILRPDLAQLLPRYLYMFLRSHTFRSQVEFLRTGSAQPQLPIRDINQIELPLPPLLEQRAISHILGSLDDKIDLNRQMNRTLEKMGQAIFKSWFIDFDPVRAKVEGRDPGLPKEIADLFPDSFEDSALGEIPKGWEVKSIGDAVQCVGGATPSTKKAEFWDGGTNPFLTPKDMSSLIAPVILDTTRHITDAGVAKISSRRLPAGTVILSSRAPIGYLAISEVSVSVNQGIIAMICNGDLPNHYVLLWTMASMETIKGKAGGTTFAEISKKNFRPIPALIPASSILDAFTKQVEPLFQQVVENVVSAESSARLRDTLLPKLISGELPIPDVDTLLNGLNIQGGQHG